MRSGAPVLHVWSVESLVRGSCLYTFLCTNFKSKYKSVYLYSRKYAYIVRSVHDHVSGTVALFVRRKLWARRYFCIQISSQELPKYTYSHKYGQNVGSIQAHRATAVCWFEACGVRLLLLVFMLYSRNDPYIVRSVHRAFGRLWSRNGHCSWTFYMLMKWSPHFGKTFVIIILVTNFSKNLRDHYIGNEFLEKFSWSLYW